MCRRLYYYCALPLFAFMAGLYPAQAADNYSAVPLKVGPATKPGFRLVSPAESGIQFTNLLTEAKIIQRQNSLNGSGLAAADYDGDGLVDLFLCNKMGPSALYRNLGNWKFENVTGKAGVSCTNQMSSGAVFGDLNSDGKLDLVVSAFGGSNALFLNNGDGSFTNITQASGISANGNCTSMALSDVDGDGDLDLYMCNFGLESILRDGGKIAVKNVGGKNVVQGRYAKRMKIIGNELLEFGEPDVLYLNNGNAQFTPAPWSKTFFDEDGKPSGELMDFGLAVQIRDINQDGAPDIYVCNDMQTPDRIWFGNGKGIFKAAPRETVRNMSYASMGVDFADINRDGHLDFITVEMLPRQHSNFLRQTPPMSPVVRRSGDILGREDVPRNVLALNRGDGTFADVAFFAGVAATDWSWTPIFLDVDLDGYDDLLISNGHLHRVNDRDATAAFDALQKSGQKKTMAVYPPINSPNAAYRNNGNLKFSDAAAEWGFNSTNVSHGMILADFDNDGDQDVAVNCLNGPALVYENKGAEPRIAVRLKGKNQNVIGAKISLVGGKFGQHQEILAGGRYLSSDDFTRSFAAWNLTNTFTIRVTWRNGTVSEISGAKANHLYGINEQGAIPANLKPGTSVSPWFEDISATLNANHHDQPTSEMDLQPTLPFKLSQRGPGLAFADLNADGWDDLILGAGAGGKVQAFLNKEGTSFANVTTQTNFSTGTVGIICAATSNKTTLISSTPARVQPNASPAELLNFLPGSSGLEVNPTTLGENINPGAFAIADIDVDGDLDIFIGGRSLPGRYPISTPSQLLLNERGKFIPQPQFSQLGNSLGMVNGAVFADLDNDGFSELIVTTEWGLLRVLKNHKGRFVEVTESLGLGKFRGLWNGVAAADVNADGYLDLVASNFGRNTHFELHSTKPPRLYFHDFDGDGSLDLVPAFYIEEQEQYMPYDPLPTLVAFLPHLKERFPLHKDFAAASIEKVIGADKSKVSFVELNRLDATLFLNKGRTFDAIALPAEAQFTPTFGISAADFTGDGAIDLFLTQNFFAMRPTDSRADAGRGLLLKNNGAGAFVPMAGQQSGIQIYGDQRASAVSDFNQDGKMDLAVSQNGAQTKLYKNILAPAGTRLHLNYGPDNPHGIGATAWLEDASGSRLGPVQQVTAGSGFWSQDSSTLLFAKIPGSDSIAVRWPGGKTTRHKVSADKQTVHLTYGN